MSEVEVIELDENEVDATEIGEAAAEETEEATEAGDEACGSCEGNANCEDDEIDADADAE